MTSRRSYPLSVNERLGVLELRVTDMTVTINRVSDKLDQLVDLKSKGQGMWIVLGPGIGAAATLIVLAIINLIR